MRPEDYADRILPAAYDDVLFIARTLGCYVSRKEDHAHVFCGVAAVSGAPRFDIWRLSTGCGLDLRFTPTDPERWALAEPILAKIVAVAAPTKPLSAHEKHVALCADALALDTLTQTERDVVKLGAQGYSQKMIAEALTMAFGTVRVHIRNVKEKIESSQR